MAICNKTCTAGRTLDKSTCTCGPVKKRSKTPGGNVSPWLYPRNPSLKKGGTMKIKKK